MDLFAAIEGRFTAKTLTAPGPAPDQLDRMLHAAACAPDHGRLTPWRFIVLEADHRALLGDAMAAARLRAAPDCDAAALAFERGKAFRAPTVVVAAAETLPNHRIPEAEQIMAVAAAVQNFVLAAHGLGFCANWKTGPAATAPEVKAALGLPPSAIIVAVLYVGTAGEGAPLRTRTVAGVVRKVG